MARRKRKNKRWTVWIAACAFLAAAIFFIAHQTAVIRSISVVGNRHLSKEEIIELSGVSVGDRLFSVDGEQLKVRLESNRYIEYVGRDFDYKGNMTIRINERTGMAYINILGYYYVLDSAGKVLEGPSSDVPTYVSGPQITGVEPNPRVIIGAPLEVRDRAQLKAMEQVILALEKTNMLGKAKSMDLKNSDNIFVVTPEEAKIVLGTTGDLVRKLTIAREVISLRENAEEPIRASTIDVSSGHNAHFIPDILPTITPVLTPTPTPSPSPTPERISRKETMEKIPGFVPKFS